MGTLYVVATPIGNLEDISKRALKVLSEVNLIIAEDTRVAAKLLKSFDISVPVESYHQHSGEDKMLFILKRLMDGADIALVSDAGTPGVSDPGNELLDFLYSKLPSSKFLVGSAARTSAGDNFSITPVPGVSAVSAALSVCGFDVSKYLFVGFWPKKKQSKSIKIIQNIDMPFVYFDSPHRVIKNLEKIKEELGARRVFVGRELTKMHETHYRGNIVEVINELKEEKHLKGEIVVVVE